MTKQIDKNWILLTVARIISAALAVSAVVLFVVALSLFHGAGQYTSSANAHLNATENQPHGLDALGATFEGSFGVAILIISIVLFILAVALFVGTSRKISKKAANYKGPLQGPF